MTILKRLLIFPLLILLNALPVFAGPQHGLSLYGPEGLKYKTEEPYEYANPNAPKGGHLVLSDFGAFTKLNPSSLKGVIAPGISALVFQTPMDSSSDDDEPFSQYGNLVEKVVLAKDHMSMVYHLYKNAKFSDGHALTADDLVFSFCIILKDASIPSGVQAIFPRY